MKYLLPIVCLINSICYGQFYFNTTFDIAVTPEVYASLEYDSSDSSLFILGNASGDHKPYVVKFDYYGNVTASVIVENDHPGFFFSAGLMSSLCKDYFDFLLAAGFVSNGGGSSNGYVIKLNSNLDTVWTRELGDLGKADPIRSLAITSDSNYVIAGATETYSPFASDQNYWLVKMDTSGNILWQNNYGGSETDYAICVDTMSDGGYILGGFTQSYGAGQNDIYVVKTDPNGNLDWEKWFGLSSYDSGAIKSLENEHVIVYGAYNYENPNTPGELASHAVAMELDENGDQVWFNEYSEFNLLDPNYYIFDEGFNSVQVVSDGYIFSGQTMDSLDGIPLGWAVKVDFSGNQIWSRTFRQRNSANYFYDVLVLPDGDVIFSGFVWPEGSLSQDGWLVRTNCLGFDGSPLAAGTWHNAALNEVILENDSERFGDGIIYWGDGDSTLFTEFDDTLLGHIYASPGNYDISLIVNACNESDTIVINADASVTGLSNPQVLKFAIFPNPAKDEVRIRYDINDLSELSYLKMYDLSGKLIYQEVIADQHNEIVLRLDQYDKGVYLVNITTENGDNLTKKLVIN